MTSVTVITTPVVPKDKLSEQDIDLNTETIVKLNNDVKPAQYADAALDVFHGNTAIDCLEDFEFSVSLNGKVLDTNPNHDSYSLKSAGCLA